jgi:hypothetical protein
VPDVQRDAAVGVGVACGSEASPASGSFGS